MSPPPERPAASSHPTSSTLSSSVSTRSTRRVLKSGSIFLPISITLVVAASSLTPCSGPDRVIVLSAAGSTSRPASSPTTSTSCGGSSPARASQDTSIRVSSSACMASTASAMPSRLPGSTTSPTWCGRPRRPPGSRRCSATIRNCSSLGLRREIRAAMMLAINVSTPPAVLPAASTLPSARQLAYRVWRGVGAPSATSRGPLELGWADLFHLPGSGSLTLNATSRSRVAYACTSVSSASPSTSVS